MVVQDDTIELAALKIWNRLHDEKQWAIQAPVAIGEWAHCVGVSEKHSITFRDNLPWVQVRMKWMMKSRTKIPVCQGLLRPIFNLKLVVSTSVSFAIRLCTPARLNIPFSCLRWL
jgi:hypothetical protein